MGVARGGPTVSCASSSSSSGTEAPSWSSTQSAAAEIHTRVAEILARKDLPGPEAQRLVEELFEQERMRLSTSTDSGTRKKAVEDSEKTAKAEAEKASVEIRDLESELFCAICRDWLLHSVSLECAHTFCFSCLDSWLQEKKFECPVCREEVSREPVRSLPLDMVVKKAVEKLPAKDQDEYQERLEKATKFRAERKRLADDLEKEVQKAIKNGKSFFQVASHWTGKEKQRFQDGVGKYIGDPREAYCKLIGLTQQWVHKATDNELNMALHNLKLQKWVSKPEERIRHRLLMYLRYG